MKFCTRLLFILCFLLFGTKSSAQIKFGDNPSNINANSLLEIESTNKGLLLPRVSLTNISSPSPLSNTLLAGTVVFNTNTSITGGSGAGIYVWDGSKWSEQATSTSTSLWSLTGNASTSIASSFAGTTDKTNLSFRTNNVQQILLDTLGGLGIGSAAFSSTNHEKLLLDNSAGDSKNAMTLKGNVNNYFQINIQNINSGNLSLIHI